VKIERIRLLRLATALDPPFPAAWDPVPRSRFEATLVYVETDEGLTGIASGDVMEGCVAVPDAPGLGVALDEDVVRRCAVG
jgi:D-galactarolactone cycloisomerase